MNGRISLRFTATKQCIRMDDWFLFFVSWHNLQIACKANQTAGMHPYKICMHSSECVKHNHLCIWSAWNTIVILLQKQRCSPPHEPMNNGCNLVQQQQCNAMLGALQASVHWSMKQLRNSSPSVLLPPIPTPTFTTFVAAFSSVGVSSTTPLLRAS